MDCMKPQLLKVIFKSMSLQNEPKTVEDYRDVVKILKLKIIKQNKRIQELQLKNKTYEEQINSVTFRGEDLQMSSRVMLEIQNQANLKKQQKQVEMNTLKGKVEVMSIFSKGLKKLGITPQSIFRIADFTYKNYVQSDYFREVMAKIKLGLTQKEISSLIFIFDQAYTGFVTRQDYSSTLQAYKIAVQDSHHPFIHQCIFKLSQMLHEAKINLIKFYEEMQAKSKSKVGQSTKKMIDLNVFEEQIKKTFSHSVSQRQIIASFNMIDLQNQGYLQKNNFLYTITSYINKLLTGQEIQTKKSHNQWSNVRSQSQQLNSAVSPKKTDKITESFNQTSKIVTFPNTTSDPQSYAAKMQKQYGVSLTQIYQELISYDFGNRLTLKTFKKLCHKLTSKLSSQFLSQLYKEIDYQFKGSLYFNELINYYLAHSNDNQMILRLFGKYFQVSDLDSQKFWFMFGLSSQSEVSKNKFTQILKKNFESKDQKKWQNFWGMFDKGRGSCNVGAIIKSIQKYQS